MFLAVPEGGGSGYNINEHKNGFKDGKDLAKLHKAAYVQISHNFRTQSEYSKVIYCYYRN